MADATTLLPDEALASERKDRAVAMLGLPELIAGITCEPLTPLRLEWLRAFGNPFLCGGTVSNEAMLQFLWFVSPRFTFTTERAQRLEFIKDLAELNMIDAREGIDAYIDRAFLDAPTGKESISYYSNTAGLYHSLNVSFPTGEWTLEKVGKTPLRVIYQLIKAADRERGCSLINRRSFVANADWYSKMETVTAESYEALGDAIEAKRSEGYKLFSDPTRCVNPDMTPEQIASAPWACAMRKEGA